MLLLSHLLGLFFCGDSDCLEVSPAEDCTALICALLANSPFPAPTSDSSQDDPCQCYCHLLLILPHIAVSAIPFPPTPRSVAETSCLFSTPVPDIDHPPIV